MKIGNIYGNNHFHNYIKIHILEQTTNPHSFLPVHNIIPPSNIF